MISPVLGNSCCLGFKPYSPEIGLSLAEFAAQRDTSNASAATCGKLSLAWPGPTGCNSRQTGLPDPNPGRDHEEPAMHGTVDLTRNARLEEARERAHSLPLEEFNPGDPEVFRSDTHWPYFDRLRKEEPVHYCKDSIFGPYW